MQRISSLVSPFAAALFLVLLCLGLLTTDVSLRAAAPLMPMCKESYLCSDSFLEGCTGDCQFSIDCGCGLESTGNTCDCAPWPV